MKVLVVNDNPAINTIIEEILADDGHNVKSVNKLSDAEVELNAFRPNVIIIEETVEGMDSMKFIDKIEKDSGIEILMLTNGKKPRPQDKPMIIGFIRKPFKAAEILDPIRRKRDGASQYTFEEEPEEEEAKKPKRSVFGKKSEKKEAASEEFILRFGKSYVVYEDYPVTIYTATKEFILQGVSTFVLSFDRKKTVQNLLDDEGVEVMTISAKGKFGVTDAAALGTIMANIMEFIEKSVRPVIVIDDLTKIIGANDLNRALTFIIQILSGTDKPFSLLMSVNEEQFTDKDKSLIAQHMERYIPTTDVAPEEVVQ